MPTEIAQAADFSYIRYAQCWEDADILLSALDIQSNHVCLSIASAGDNTLAMLSRSPQRIIAVDLNPAQIACLELRVAAYRELSYSELLILMGAENVGAGLADNPCLPEKISQQNPPFAANKQALKRNNLYRRCRSQLSSNARRFWDDRPDAIAKGIGNIGKFERYLALFRRYILPLIHHNNDITQILQGSTREKREGFYDRHWNNWRWQLLFRAFFSRFMMGRLGRDPSFFHYVNKNIAEHLLERTRYVLTALNPADNPYLQWIATGHYLTALPYALRPENFEAIRDNLHRLEWHCMAIEDFLETVDDRAIDRYNLSNIFEYMSLDNYHRILKELVRVGKPNARLAYWNLLAERRRPDYLGDRLRSLTDLAEQLYQQDKAFFYSAFIVEEVIGG